MKHTPGPWDTRGFDFIGTAESAYQTIAYCSDHRNKAPRHPDETLANARLIAAAPDLLEACRAARAIISEPGDYDGLAWDEAEHLLQIAIAKATGKEAGE